MFGCNRCFGAGVLSAILFGKFSGRQGEGQTHKRTAGYGCIWSVKIGYQLYPAS